MNITKCRHRYICRVVSKNENAEGIFVKDMVGVCDKWLPPAMFAMLKINRPQKMSLIISNFDQNLI